VGGTVNNAWHCLAQKGRNSGGIPSEMPKINRLKPLKVWGGGGNNRVKKGPTWVKERWKQGEFFGGGTGEKFGDTEDT